MSLKWLPNALTWLRIIAAPIVAGLIFFALQSSEAPSREFYASVAFVLFVLAAITDWFDGFLARKLSASSDFGAKLDLWADKLLVFAVLIGVLVFYPLFAIFGLLSLSVRDAVIMRLRANRPDVNLKATFLAKSKTAIIMTGMAICLFAYARLMGAEQLQDTDQQILMMRLIRFGLSVFVFGCVLSLGTGLQYLQAAAQTKPPQ